MTHALPANAEGARAAPAKGLLWSAAALTVWALLMAASHLWGQALIASGAEIKLNAPPLAGTFDPLLTLRVLPALVLGAALVLSARLVARLPWRLFLAVSLLGAALWAFSLAYVDGPEAWFAPHGNLRDYLDAVPQVGSPGRFLASFVDRIAGYPLHVQGHPPGTVLFLWLLDRIGMQGNAPAAIGAVTVGASAVPAMLLSVREVVGLQQARRCGPFLVLAPAAIWIATSADALFTGVGAWAITCIVLATGRRDRRADLLAVTGGLIFGLSLQLSYGAAALGAIALFVVVRRRHFRSLLLAGTSVLLVALAFGLEGFWWWEGLTATVERYSLGVSADRPYRYFLFANLAAFSVAVGPAAAVALARLRRGPAWLLVGGALVAVVVSDLSGLSKGEVERIWLPYAPWVLSATGSSEIASARGWLAAQATWTLATQVWLRSPW